MKKPTLFTAATALLLIFIYNSSCVHKPQGIESGLDGNYPPAVANIILNKCAISGCHNSASYTNCNNFLLDTWDHLFDGGQNGAMVVAYSPQYSPLLYAVNTDSTLGLTLPPTMPYSTPGRTFAPLSKSEYMTLYNWIASGAPDANGNIPFASNAATRQKIYLTQSGNDLMAVIDGQRKVVTRYFSIGADSAQIESAHEVEFSSDGQYAYVCFYSGNYLQKIDVQQDKVVSGVNISNSAPNGSGWSILFVSPGDTTVCVTNFTSFGGFVMVNDASMSVNSYSGGIVYPHGICSNSSFDTFFITEQFGNTIYKCAPHAKPHYYFKNISIDGNPPETSSADSTTPNPHQIQMVPDNSRYFVSCQGSNEVRVMDAFADTLIKVIPVGRYPQEMALSTSKHYLLVTCMQDVNANTPPNCLGSVYVIDYDTYNVVAVLNGNFFQPHDLCVDEQDGYIFIASTNGNPNGLPIHHPIPGGGRPGWYNVYDLNTLKPADNKTYEVLVFPYAMNARF